MFSTNLIEFKRRQTQLHKEAEQYRLVKSLEKINPHYSRAIKAIGQLLVNTGQQLLRRTQSAH